jgi:NAD(P)-dependent dehydrogenase (short-subunit alcohol dehydrogenase family)
MDLTGRVAIITGAGKGLGRAYALALAAHGAAIVVNNRRHPGERDEDTSASKVVSEIRARGGRAIANFNEVEHVDAGQTMVDAAIKAFGQLDIIVANAAVPQATSFHKLTNADFRRVFDVSFLGTLHLLQAAWPILRQQGYGRVITTTSSAGRFGNHGLSAYGAAKAAVEGLTRSLAAEGANRNISVNAISPYAFSQMTADHMSPAMAERFGPEQVVPMVLWLASEQCTANGEVIVAGAGQFRRGYCVETPSVAGNRPMADVFAEMSTNVGRPHASAQAAFESFLRDLDQHRERRTAAANQF